MYHHHPHLSTTVSVVDPWSHGHAGSIPPISRLGDVLGRGKVWTVVSAQYRLPTQTWNHLAPTSISNPPPSWHASASACDSDLLSSSSGSDASASASALSLQNRSLSWHPVVLKYLHPSHSHSQSWMEPVEALAAAHNEISLYSGPLKRLQGSVVPVLYDVQQLVAEDEDEEGDGDTMCIIMEKMGESVGVDWGRLRDLERYLSFSLARAELS